MAGALLAHTVSHCLCGRVLQSSAQRVSVSLFTYSGVLYSACARLRDALCRNTGSTVGGILCLVTGTWGVMSGSLLAAITCSYPTAWIQFNPFQTLIINRMAPLGIALGAVAIAGGVFALRRRRWSLALAGAICAAMIPPPFFLGVLAIIFLSVSRPDFEEPCAERVVEPADEIVAEPPVQPLDEGFLE